MQNELPMANVVEDVNEPATAPTRSCDCCDRPADSCDPTPGREPVRKTTGKQRLWPVITLGIY
jgi:hypothetical protein